MSNQADTAPFFSLVVPIYKTEQYLEQCLSSIKNQSFQDFECIVVNDGSLGVELAKFTELFALTHLTNTLALSLGQLLE